MKITPKTLAEDRPLAITICKFGVRFLGRTSTKINEPVSFIENNGEWYVKSGDAEGFKISLRGRSYEVMIRSLGAKLMESLGIKEITKFYLIEAGEKGLYKIQKDGKGTA